MASTFISCKKPSFSSPARSPLFHPPNLCVRKHSLSSTSVCSSPFQFLNKKPSFIAHPPNLRVRKHGLSSTSVCTSPLHFLNKKPSFIALSITMAYTSDESFLRYEPHSNKVAFKSDKMYHVFLSFRGSDVRKNFVDHLFEALSAAGLNVYKDDENLEKGEEIWPSLKGAIDSSAIRIPIFSDGYAQSDWCLREAAAMLETPGLIIPLFYYVNPTHVRYPEKGSSPYKQSFLKHYSHSDRHTRQIEWWKRALHQICPWLPSYGQSVRYKREEIDLWKKALFEICKRSGWSTDITDGLAERQSPAMKYIPAAHQFPGCFAPS